MVLLEELGHVHNQIADNRQAGQRTQHDGLFQAADVGQAGQAVAAVDVHAVGAADAFAAGAAEGQGVVLGFELDDGIQQFDVGGFDFQFVVFHVRLGVHVGIVAVHLQADFFHLAGVPYQIRICCFRLPERFSGCLNLCGRFLISKRVWQA